jgi:hypothetical protein
MDASGTTHVCDQPEFLYQFHRESPNHTQRCGRRKTDSARFVATRKTPQQAPCLLVGLGTAASIRQSLLRNTGSPLAHVWFSMSLA